MNDTASRSAKRAAEVDFDDVAELDAPAPARARARRGAAVAGVSRRVVALALTSTLSAAALFAFAFAGRGADLFSENSQDSALAVPSAAAAAVREGFPDRSEEVSRNAVRSNLSEAAADASAQDRTAAMGASNDAAVESYLAMSSDERDRLMDEDMKLVSAQADKLKKEAEEAAKRLEEARKAAAAAGASTEISAEDLQNLSSTGGSMPLKSNYRVGARFGQTGSWSRYHTGQDFPAPIGTPIYAVASGIVLSPTAGGWAGTNVVLQHANGGSTLYAHMSRRVVSTGTTVKAGQLIGYVGVSGRSFGAHLHMEYYKPGVTPGKVYEASDPMAFLRSLGVR